MQRSGGAGERCGRAVQSCCGGGVILARARCRGSGGAPVGGSILFLKLDFLLSFSSWPSPSLLFDWRRLEGEKQG